MTPEQEALIVDALPLVPIIVTGIIKRCPPYIDRFDLEGAGHEGLVEAALRYRECGAPFRSFASLRIRGSVMDFMRKAYNPATGGNRGRNKGANTAIQLSMLVTELENRLFYQPDNIEDELTLESLLQYVKNPMGRDIMQRLAEGAVIREAAEANGKCESRGSQLRTEAINDIRRALGMPPLPKKGR